MPGERVRWQGGVQTEQQAHVAVVYLRGVLSARDQRRQSALPAGGHRVGASVAQAVEHCRTSFNILWHSQVENHLYKKKCEFVRV